MIVSDPTDPDYNCHVSYDDATKIIGDMLYAPNWKAAGETSHKRALLTATMLMGRHVDWYGTVTDEDQEPPWPRAEVQVPDREMGTYYDSATVPGVIQLATVEYAEALLGENLQTDQETGLSSLSVEGVSLVFKETDRKDVMPDGVKFVCGQHGTVMTGKSSVVEVVRR